jgi:hypothetical protein
MLCGWSLLTQKGSRTPIADRFWEHVDKQGPIPEHKPELGQCWLWTGHKSKYGYGGTTVNGKRQSAHRVSSLLEHGRWPEPFCYHHCDKPACVRPSHLFEGEGPFFTQHPELVQGDKNPAAKLTNAQVLEIRRLIALKKKNSQIAKMFGVSSSTISHIRTGRKWSDVK